MKFFELTHPDYSTDLQFSKANPVEQDDKDFLPGVYCEKCDDQWASSNRLRVKKGVQKQITDYLRSINIPDVISAQQWSSLILELSTITGLPKENFHPGAPYGVPGGILKKKEVCNFSHPFPGLLWVTSDVMSLIIAEKLTGIQFMEVKLKNSKRMAGFQSPQLWEIIITGKAWRQGHNVDNVTSCNCCKRTVFPEPNNLKVDISRWDGSDFFNIDLNPNIIIVTERVCEVLDKGKFTNYLCIPIN